MKTRLIILLLLISTFAFGQTAVKELIIVGPYQDTTATTGTNGRFIHNKTNGKYYLYNVITGFWQELTLGVTGTGDVDGPASATDNAITRFDGTTGKLIKNSAVTIDNSGNVLVPTGTLTLRETRVLTIDKSIDDIFIGKNSGNLTTTGTGANIGIGEDCLLSLTNGVGNLVWGALSGDGITSGSGNIEIASSFITTGSNNILISAAGTGLTATASSQISIADFIVGNYSTKLLGIGTTSPDRLLHAEMLDASTNTVLYPFRVTRTSSGTPANGIGGAIEFEVETTVSNNEVGATIEAVTTDVTSTSEDFALDLYTMDAGAAATRKLRIEGNTYTLGATSFAGSKTISAINSTSNAALTVSAQTSISLTGTAFSTISDLSSTTGVAGGLSVFRQTTGTATNDIGVNLDFNVENASGTLKQGVVFEITETDVTNGSEDFKWSIKTMAAGAAAAERVSIDHLYIKTTTNDFVTDNSAKGLILKSPDGHYWRVTIDNLGILNTADLGTSL